MMEEFPKTLVSTTDHNKQAVAPMSLKSALKEGWGSQDLCERSSGGTFAALMADDEGGDLKAITKEPSDRLVVAVGMPLTPSLPTAREPEAASVSPQSGPFLERTSTVPRGQSADVDFDITMLAEARRLGDDPVQAIVATQDLLDIENRAAELNKEQHAQGPWFDPSDFALQNTGTQAQRDAFAVFQTAPDKGRHPETTLLEVDAVASGATQNTSSSDFAENLTPTANRRSGLQDTQAALRAATDPASGIIETAPAREFVPTLADTGLEDESRQPLGYGTTLPASAGSADIFDRVSQPGRAQSNSGVGLLNGVFVEADQPVTDMAYPFKANPPQPDAAQTPQLTPEIPKTSFVAAIGQAAPENTPGPPPGSAEQKSTQLQSKKALPTVGHVAPHADRLEKSAQSATPGALRPEQQITSQNEPRAAQSEFPVRFDRLPVTQAAVSESTAPIHMPDSDVPGAHNDGSLAETRALARSDPTVSVRSEASVSRAVFAQIRDVLVSSNTQVTEIQLSPEELGRVRLTFSGSDAAHLVAIHVERSETLELVRRHLDALKQELAQAGFDTTDIDLSHGDGNSKWQGDQTLHEGNRTDEQTKDGPLLAGSASHVPAYTPVLTDGRLDLRL